MPSRQAVQRRSGSTPSGTDSGENNVVLARVLLSLRRRRRDMCVLDTVWHVSSGTAESGRWFVEACHIGGIFGRTRLVTREVLLTVFTRNVCSAVVRPPWSGSAACRLSKEVFGPVLLDQKLG